MTREEVLKASTAQINEWIDETIMKDRKHIAGDWPKWSSDIAAAWVVVDKLTQEYRITLFKFPAGEWSCKFSDTPQVIKPTAPEAICKAALLAVMEATP